MLNPEYVDEDEHDKGLVNIGFSSDGNNAVEISIQKKDVFRFGRMLIDYHQKHIRNPPMK